jgi:hypothetical protein
MYTKPQSSSLTTLNSTDTGYESSKANISCPSEVRNKNTPAIDKKISGKNVRAKISIISTKKYLS